METKPLLYGLIGFFIGGFIVSIAATTFDKPSGSNMTMSEMTTSLKNKKGDDYDKAFVLNMIDHHQGAVDMAELSSSNAKHEEIKILSENIITAQQKEINDMEKWLADWGYGESSQSTTHVMH